MGFDLIGMKIDTEHEGDTTPVFPVSIVMNGVSYDSLEEYLESRGIPGNSIKFSCSNRNWYTIWSYINFINAVSEDDFEAGNSNSGHFIDGEKSINIFNIHKDNNDLDKYLEQECAWADDDAKIDISSMINRFMIFCKKSEGFLIL
tara:strand:- start:236 stop:673 length:438 start_codon:yes stop_codon:yes gene_type:complete